MFFDFEVPETAEPAVAISHGGDVAQTSAQCVSARADETLLNDVSVHGVSDEAIPDSVSAAFAGAALIQPAKMQTTTITFEGGIRSSSIGPLVPLPDWIDLELEEDSDEQIETTPASHAVEALEAREAMIVVPPL